RRLEWKLEKSFVPPLTTWLNIISNNQRQCSNRMYFRYSPIFRGPGMAPDVLLITFEMRSLSGILWRISGDRIYTGGLRGMTRLFVFHLFPSGCYNSASFSGNSAYQALFPISLHKPAEVE